MQILTPVTVGSLESSDVLVSLAPSEDGARHLEVESIVIKQYGRRITAVANEMLDAAGVDSGTVRIQDRGALECTLRARIKTALDREVKATV